MIKKYILIVFGLLVAPSFVHAAVSINEVAWMGTAESQYGEWIELYNDEGSAVDLNGWKLEAGGSTLFTLTKSISAGGYLVIERTTASSPDPLPGVSGESGSFGGSGLSNSGESLVLKNDTGMIVDSIDASSGWPAGDATTKDTMQKSGNSWVTGEGTPNAQNRGAVSQNTSSDNKTISRDDPEAIEIPVPVIYSTISGPTTLATNIVGAFTPKVGMTDGSIFAVGKFFWNFGDGETMTQQTNDPVRHTYTRPGKYVVVLEYSKNSSTEIPDSTVKSIVTVPMMPITLSVTRDAVSVKNVGNSEIDISNFVLSSVKHALTIPHGTILLAGADIVFSRTLFGGGGEVVSLVYPNSTVFAVANTKPISGTANLINATIQKSVASSRDATQVSSNTLLANVVSAQTTDTDPVSSGQKSSKTLFTLLGFVLLVTAAIVLFLKLRKSKVTSSGGVTANDIKIIESEE